MGSFTLQKQKIRSVKIHRKTQKWSDIDNKTMEGELWKWTNYWNGWQSRWFILDDGVLSYFKSYEEVNQGCKGSISLNVCEIVVNDKEITRFDLNVSNEQYIYMRANSEKERQQWLVALGSSKASLANRQQRRRISSTTSIKSDTSNLASMPMTSNVSPDLIKTKKSELRLYCDLLNQQVHTIKSGATEESLTQVESGYQLLGATCDTFIKTLDELMNLADANIDGHHSRERSSTPLSFTKSSRGRLASESSRTSPPIQENIDEEEDTKNHHEEETVTTNGGDQSGFYSVFGSNCEQEGKFVLPFKTTFPMKKYEIEVIDFVTAAKEILIIYDFLGKSSFAPIKTEVKGHIKCLKTKHLSNSQAFTFIIDILQQEKNCKKSSVPNSATWSITWILRHLSFLHHFLHTFLTTDQALQEALNSSYENTLMEFHDQVIRNVFTVAMQTAPSRSRFTHCFGLPPSEDLERDFQSKVVPVLGDYLHNLEHCILALKTNLEL